MNGGRFQRGFTLIEVIVSMMILTIGISASLAMANASRNAIAFAKNRTEAAALAREKMEELRALSYGTLVSGAPREEEAIGDFRREWSVRRDSPGPRLAAVFVSVRWTDRLRKSHEVSVGTVRPEGVAP
jgi:prepilin-type N-terminal cleavage/methylation domain-containing protein